MKVATDLGYKKHILVCVNEREEDKSCCKKVKGYEIFRKLKDFVISNGFAKDIWVTKTGCLGFCNDVGTTIVVYPDKVWFMETTEEDLEGIKEFVTKDLL